MQQTLYTETHPKCSKENILHTANLTLETENNIETHCVLPETDNSFKRYSNFLHYLTFVLYILSPIGS